MTPQQILREYLFGPVARRTRKLVLLAADAAALVLVLEAAVWLRFDGVIPAAVTVHLPLVFALSLATKLPVFATQGLYSLSWPQAGLEDALAVFRAVTLGSALFWLIVFVLREGVLEGFPRAALVIDYVLTLYAIGGLRIWQRAYRHVIRPSASGGRRTLIVGAGAAGEQIVRSLRETPACGHDLVGFIDDHPHKQGTRVRGLPVLGGRDRIPAIVRKHGIEAVLIAMPSVESSVIRSIMSLAREAGVDEIRIVPALNRVLTGQINFTDLREVQLSDLLGRDTVCIDTTAVKRWLDDQVVLVTGAAGSIGSELCEQIGKLCPRQIVLVDQDETGLFWIEQRLLRLGYPFSARLLDIRDAASVRDVFLQVRPKAVFHVAAYKHVGLLEREPEQAVATNLLGTYNVAAGAVEAGVEKFVLISTDKAVNPSSIMGATKRAAEQVCIALNEGATRFIAVRFGNVLGSRGSIIPIFQERIRRGEPLIVRGPNMRRYFMAVSEAVLLVLQAAVSGEGGEVFVLDMGEPVRIMDLARDFVRLLGLRPDTDVPIVLAEPEPGEKEHEDLLTAEEGTLATLHNRIFVARVSSRLPTGALLSYIEILKRMVRERDSAGLVSTLQLLVPTYKPSDLWRDHAPSPSLASSPVESASPLTTEGASAPQLAPARGFD